MFWKISSLLTVLTLIGGGCSTSGTEQKSSFNSYTSEVTGASVRDCSLLYPDNPYSSGSGHYAGFEWAERKDVSSCGGNSRSFIEGCEDYVEQANDYANCLNK